MKLLNNRYDDTYYKMAADSSSTRFICKICRRIFEDQSILNQYIEELYHHPKRTATINEIIGGVCEQRINFPNPKDEIVIDIENKNKDKVEFTPKVIDTIRYLPARRYNEADLALGKENNRKAQYDKTEYSAMYIR